MEGLAVLLQLMVAFVLLVVAVINLVRVMAVVAPERWAVEVTATRLRIHRGRSLVKSDPLNLNYADITGVSQIDDRLVCEGAEVEIPLGALGDEERGALVDFLGGLAREAASTGDVPDEMAALRARVSQTI